MRRAGRFSAAACLAFSSLFLVSPAQAEEVWWAQTNNEHEEVSLTAPDGWQFVWGRAWYGDPADWSCGADVSGDFLNLINGTSSAVVRVTNETFGDPCGGTEKVLRFTWGIIPVYSEPVIQPTPKPLPELSPEPVAPSPAPSPEFIPEFIPTPEPAPQPAPEPEPIPEIAPPVMPVEPPAPPAPTVPPVPAPEPPIPPVAPIPPLPVEPPPAILPLPPELPMIEQMAILAEEAKADDPVIPQELASIPLLGDVAGAVLDTFNALGNVGADLTPEVRKQAQETIIASVLVSNIATTSVMASASSAASYRRKE